jgi:hypothetical protein
MGYGSRALKALNAYYSGEIMSVEEETRVEPEYPFPGKVGKVCSTLPKRGSSFFSRSAIVNGFAHGRTFCSCAIGDAAAATTVIRKETGDPGLPRCFVRPHTTTLRQVDLRSSLVFTDVLCVGFGRGRVMSRCIFARQRANSLANILVSWFVD